MPKKDEKTSKISNTSSNSCENIRKQYDKLVSLKKEFDKEGNPLEDSYQWDRVFKDVVDWLLNE